MFQTILKKISSKIKIFKLANILRINPFFFFDLIIFHGSKLFRSNVDDKLIILGGSSGQAFIGNTKYLYFYLRDNTDYKIYYLVKSKELQKKLEDQGIKTLFGYSIKAIRILRKARAVFVTHGFIDVLPIKFSPRTVFVQTWHGSDIKILKRPEYFSKYIYSKWSTLTRVKLRNHHVYDYVLNTSGEKKPLQILANAFNYPMKRILPLGYPRNDILFSEDLQLVKQIKKYYDISNKVSRIMLYAPTFREDFTTKDPFSEEDLIKLNELCKKVNSILILKTHIREDIINLATLSNIKTIRKESDIQELLLISDVLITDYSSVYTDFLLLNRPVLFYVYDYDEYITERGIYYEHLEEIAPGPLLYTPEELFNVIENISTINNKDQSKRIKINNYFNKFQDGNSSQRLLKFLKLI